MSASHLMSNEIWQLILGSLATAIRNFQYIQSQDWLHKNDEIEPRKEVSDYFPEIAETVEFKSPYSSENYRRLPKKEDPFPHGDPLRHFLCSHLSVWITYSKEEKKRFHSNFESNYRPRDVSPAIEKLARFIIAMFGAISILVPTIIMSFHKSRTKALVTTSVAVVLFACSCSLTLRTANDQTLAATAGYAAVLMVFVGLTT
ncbi:hypothetical protein N431DRAFT_525599 [Stipitochalara longipes BDJ]|nr:hypothetical protein N431DRAFT_525599 [Stipitochalara longipes BDJ]